MTEKPFIKVWRFDDAPEEYQAMSGHGGDEDYVAEFPVSLEYEAGMLFREGTRFGYCSIQEERLPDGRIVLIGAHA